MFSGLEGNRTRRQESEGGAALSRNISMILEVKIWYVWYVLEIFLCFVSTAVIFNYLYLTSRICSKITRKQSGHLKIKVMNLNFERNLKLKKKYFDKWRRGNNSESEHAHSVDGSHFRDGYGGYDYFHVYLSLSSLLSGQRLHEYLLFQFYSMDCYFRQYWRDNRLSFKGLKQTANNVIINQVVKDLDLMFTLL